MYLLGKHHVHQITNPQVRWKLFLGCLGEELKRWGLQRHGLRLVWAGADKGQTQMHMYEYSLPPLSPDTGISFLTSLLFPSPPYPS